MGQIIGSHRQTNGKMARCMLFIILGTFVCVVSTNYDLGSDQLEESIEQLQQSQESDGGPKVFEHYGKTKREALSEANIDLMKEERRLLRRIKKNAKKAKAKKTGKKGKKSKSKPGQLRRNEK